MTPVMHRRQQKNLYRAIWHWYRLGGDIEQIIAIADVLYNTKIGAFLNEHLPKKHDD
jgi:hypothetical protein